jgi:predicted DNA-binding transcriptional regulator AlpA
MDKLLLTRADLKQLGIELSRWTLRRLEDDNAFPKSVRVGKRRIAWPRDAVLLWIEERTHETKKVRPPDRNAVPHE